MPEIPCDELNKLERRIVRTSRLAISILLLFLLPILGTGVAVYAQVMKDATAIEQHAVLDIARERASLIAVDRSQSTREKMIEIETRVKGIEVTLGELKDGQKDNRAVLEEIRREVRK